MLAFGIAFGVLPAYRVVKFIVKVRLMENNVNNHVGNVIVVNVMSQNKAPGMNVTAPTRARLKPEDEPPPATCCPTDFMEADSVGREEDVCAPIDDAAGNAGEDIMRKYAGHKDRSSFSLLSLQNPHSTA